MEECKLFSLCLQHAYARRTVWQPKGSHSAAFHMQCALALLKEACSSHCTLLADGGAYLRAVRVASSCPSCGSSTHAYALCPPVEQLILHARAALQLEKFEGVEPETLTCLALAMSGGQERLETWNEDTGGLRIGLCQVRSHLSRPSSGTDVTCTLCSWPAT